MTLLGLGAGRFTCGREAGGLNEGAGADLAAGRRETEGGLDADLDGDLDGGLP